MGKVLILVLVGAIAIGTGLAQTPINLILVTVGTGLIFGGIALSRWRA
jgi:hypothetical protein